MTKLPDNFFSEQYSDDDADFLPILPDEEDEKSIKSTIPDQLPLLPLRNTVLFPGVVLPITISRDKSILAVKEAHKTHKLLAVVSQTDASIEEPEFDDLYKIGTVAQILRMIKMPDGSTTAIIQGRNRFQTKELLTTDPYMTVRVKVLKEDSPKNDKEFDASIMTIKDLASNIIKLNPQIPSEAAIMIKNISNPVTLTFFIGSNLNIDVKQKQELLEISKINDLVKSVLTHLNNELQMLEIKNQIHNKVRGDIDKQQREYFLHQQLKLIQEELGQNNPDRDIQRLREKVAKLSLPGQVKKSIDKEFEKLQRMNPAAADYSVVMNYCELVLDLPWNVYTEDHNDINKAKLSLDKDHFGIEKIKERILEYLAVLKLKGDLKSPILCFVGPPGVGKTSLGQSIAKALNRKYVRVALGGLHDEAEIRGHRKTYIGAMPGRIVQSLKKAQSSNPVMILDEIDKVGNDYKGDPSSALLEVLDPEQNHAFYDNYLELEYDLSKVMFIATANSLASIQPALRDRMEIISLEGYSVEEKVQIGKKHLLLKQIANHGLKAKDVSISDKVLESIVEKYTKESGVRELDRVLASVMRKIARKIAAGEQYNPNLKFDEIEEILGPEKFDKSIYTEEHLPGVAVGMAWTSVGGDILFIESAITHGSGQLILTGSLGDVMKESATTAFTFLKAHAEDYNINPKIFSKVNVHLHFPEGAVPKDGPSAGITILTALTSLFTQRRVKPFLAMSGEISLRGRVLPVGGIKEKILAAKRSGIKEIILCEKNRQNVQEVDQAYIKNLKIHYIKEMNEALEIALQPKVVKDSIDFEVYLKKEESRSGDYD
jgi:ATP-dependent Lon protease